MAGTTGPPAFKVRAQSLINPNTYKPNITLIKAAYYP